MINDPECPKAGKHRELETDEIKKSEEAMHRTIAVIQSFTNPFTIPDKDRLYSLASGAPTPLEVEIYIFRAEDAGNASKKALIEYASRTSHQRPVSLTLSRNCGCLP